MVGRDVPDRVRTFLLTVFVVDDIVALLVIAVGYTEAVHVGYLRWRWRFSGCCMLVKRLRFQDHISIAGGQ